MPLERHYVHTYPIAVWSMEAADASSVLAERAEDESSDDEDPWAALQMRDEWPKGHDAVIHQDEEENFQGIEFVKRTTFLIEADVEGTGDIVKRKTLSKEGPIYKYTGGTLQLFWERFVQATLKRWKEELEVQIELMRSRKACLLKRSSWAEAEELGYSIVPQAFERFHHEELWLKDFICGGVFVDGRITKEAAVQMRREKQLNGEWGTRAVGIIKVSGVKKSEWARDRLAPREFHPFEYFLYTQVDPTFDDLKKTCSNAYPSEVLPLDSFRFETPQGIGIDKDMSIRTYFHAVVDGTEQPETVTIEVADVTHLEVPYAPRGTLQVPGIRTTRRFELRMAEVVLYLHDE